MAAATGGQKRDHAVASQADFLAGVEIVVVGVDLDPPRGPPAGRFEQGIGGNQMVVNGVAQMRKEKTTEGPMPVRAVALSTIKFGPRLRDEVRPLDRLFLRGDLLQPLTDLQH